MLRKKIILKGKITTTYIEHKETRDLIYSQNFEKRYHQITPSFLFSVEI